MSMSEQRVIEQLIELLDEFITWTPARLKSSTDPDLARRISLQAVNLYHSLVAWQSTEAAGKPSSPASEAYTSVADKPEINLDEWQEGTLDRWLTNGEIILDNGKAIFIPESAIRDLGARQNDRLQVKASGEILPSGRPKYLYKLLERATPPVEEDRTEIVGPLEAEYTLNSQWSYFVRSDQVKIYVNSDFINQQNLKPGDVLTVAYRPSDLQRHPMGVYGRVVHWHRTEETTTPWTRPETSKPTRYKTNHSASEGKTSDTESEKLLSPDTLVLLIGGRNRVAYEAAVKELGASFEHVSGIHRNSERITAAVRRADVVVMIPHYMNHSVSEMAMQEARSTNTPVIFAKSENVSGLVQQLKEELPEILSKT